MAKSAKIPFSLSRNDGASLTDQMLAGFRFAISSGYYAPDETLPSLKTISDTLGVSMIVTRTAMKRLAEERLVRPLPGVGCRVAGGCGQFWKGRVLFVVPDRNDSYHVSIVCDILRRRLMAEGYFFSQITVAKGRDGTYDMSQLKLQLKDPKLFVVEMFGVPEISRCVVASGVRSLVVARDDERAYKGAAVVRFASNAAVPDFVSRCVRTGVRSVLQVGFEYGAADASVLLGEEGVSVESVYVAPPGVRDGVIETVKRSTLAFFDKFLARKTSLPDVIYFTDDHAAEAGLLALALRGIKVPGDVRVVSWSNKGLAPVYVKSVARMEVDPYENGETLAGCVLDRISGTGKAPLPCLSARFVDGETFAENNKQQKTHRG